ncbi:MAG: MFS transporter [Candidatus Symbiodolus clandestinus]
MFSHYCLPSVAIGRTDAFDRLLTIFVLLMLTTRQLSMVSLFGLMSGFTLMLTAGALNYWLAQAAISLPMIGAFSLVALPYAINFLWAPLFDIYHLGWLGKRLGPRMAWTMLIQLLLILAVWQISTLTPTHHIQILAGTSLLIALLSSAQDVLLGAIKTELIAKSAQGAAAGMYIFGYRIGMLLSSSGAIYLSTLLSWQLIYQIAAGVIGVLSLLIGCILYPLPSANPLSVNPITTTTPNKPVSARLSSIFGFLKEALQPIGPSKLGLIVLFLILYRLPDNFISMMINPFLLALRYDALEIASVSKCFGIISAMLGGIIASYWMKKNSLYPSLLRFGILHAGAHLLFILHRWFGKQLNLLIVTIGLESITGGMVMAAYIGFIASLCTGRWRATQYAFFSSMMGLSRATLPALSGYLVQRFGWDLFFVTMTLLTIPSLLILKHIVPKLVEDKLNYPQ